METELNANTFPIIFYSGVYSDLYQVIFVKLVQLRQNSQSISTDEQTPFIEI